MYRTEAVFADFFIMQFCAIALVFVKTVFWEFFVQARHVAVAGDFCDYRGGGN